MFDSMDLKSTGVITFDRMGLSFNMEHMLAKTATLDPHLILNHGNLEQLKTFHKAVLNGSSKGGSFLILDFAVYFCSL